MDKACQLSPSSPKQASEFEKLFLELNDQLDRMDQFSSEISGKINAISSSNPTPSCEEKENPIPDGIVGELTRKLKWMRIMNNRLLDSVNELRRIVG